MTFACLEGWGSDIRHVHIYFPDTQCSFNLKMSQIVAFLILLAGPFGSWQQLHYEKTRFAFLGWKSSMKMELDLSSCWHTRACSSSLLILFGLISSLSTVKRSSPNKPPPQLQSRTQDLDTLAEQKPPPFWGGTAAGFLFSFFFPLQWRTMTNRGIQMKWRLESVSETKIKTLG